VIPELPPRVKLLLMKPPLVPLLRPVDRDRAVHDPRDASRAELDRLHGDTAGGFLEQRA
jgi:hypothetical protein